MIEIFFSLMQKYLPRYFRTKRFQGTFSLNSHVFIVNFYHHQQHFFEIVSFGLGRRSWRGNGTGTRRGDGEGFRNGYRREVRRSPTRLPFRIGWIRSRTRTRTTIAIWRSRLQSYVIFYVHFSIFFFLFLFFNHRQAFVAFVRITFQCQ